MAFSSGSSSSFSAEINVTPLIDVLLVLLIIFMVIVPVMSRGIESAVPQKNKDSATSQPPTQLVVQVQRTAAGTPLFRINQREVAANELRPELQRIFATRQDHTIFVQGERDLSYGDVAAAVGEARAAGAAPIALLGSLGSQTK